MNAILAGGAAAASEAAVDREAIVRLCDRPREPVVLLRREPGGRVDAAPADGRPAAGEVIARLPPLYPEWLGSQAFLDAHGVRFAYVAGEMAHGIATVDMVTAMARAGMLGFFGAAGLPVAKVAAAIGEIRGAIPAGAAFGVNLIHSPETPGLENALVDLFLREQVRRVSASAFMALSPAVVRYAFSGVRRGPDGALQRPNHIFAKVSRPEVARQFMSPPPAEMLQALVAAGGLTPMEAQLAGDQPVALDVTGEADSGGHTDNRPLTVLLPSLVALRRAIAGSHPAAAQVRIGAAGGIGTPSAVAAAFALGADYVLTGSINQAAVESGLAPAARGMLAQAGMADVVMAPSADMFEMGVKVQVLRRGTMFAARAGKLYELYRAYPSLEALPDANRKQLEKDVFRRPLAEVVAETRAYFAEKDPQTLERARSDPHFEMALVFRWYLGLSSRWPMTAEPNRQIDFQIWCGPAMGAFNDWVSGSYLEPLENRSVVQIARNLLEGAACITRAQQLRAAGCDVPADALDFRPRRLD